MNKFGESSVTREAKRKQDNFIKITFLSASNDKAREMINKKYNVSSKVDGILYAHLLAISRKDDIAIRRLVIRAIENFVIDYFEIYPAIAELKRFFISEEIRELEIIKKKKKKQLKRLIEGK